jgi:chorismate mutase/prephenate dehydratase
MSTKLNKLRRKIDKIDKDIVALLNKRARVILDIGKFKKTKKESIYVPDREKAIYTKVTKENKGPLSDGSIKACYREIMSGCLNLEKPIKVAYLGPPFTFTHIAAMKKFGSSVEYVDCNGIHDVFGEVDRGRVDYGVVPIENSTEGAVNHTLDMFIELDTKIYSEIYLEISHNLLSKVRSLKAIKKIYSNPSVFGQCRMYLEENFPRAQLVEVSSTTRAAEIASKEKNTACIASILAADKYKLKVMASSVEDSPHNVTRFLVIGNEVAQPTDKDKTSIMFSIKDRVGALHDILVPFKKYSVNLTKIESRPSKQRAWEYYFFVDMGGHYKDKKVSKALSELGKSCTYIKILGSYPVEAGQ